MNAKHIAIALYVQVGALSGCGKPDPVIVQAINQQPGADAAPANEGAPPAVAPDEGTNANTSDNGSEADTSSDSTTDSSSSESSRSLSSDSSTSADQYDSSSSYSGQASESESGMDSSNGGSLATTSPADTMAQFASLFVAKGTPTAATTSLVPKNYLGQSQFAYAMGAEVRAYELYLAHLAIEPELAASNYGKAMFSTLMKKPVWHQQWGIASSVQRDGYTGDAHPPVDDMKAPQEGGSQQGRGNNRVFESSTSDSSVSGTDMSGNALGGGVASPDNNNQNLLAETFGVVPASVQREFTLRYVRGDFGTGLSSMPSTPPSSMAEATQAEPPSFDSTASDTGARMTDPGISNSALPPFGEQAKSAAPTLPMISTETPRYVPGMLFLGEGTRAELLEKAKAQELDFLFILEAKVDIQPNGVVNNRIQVRLFQADTGDQLATSKILDNVEIYRNQKHSPATKVVDEAVGNVFAVLDRKIKCMPMPKLLPEHVTARIASLVVMPMEKRLESLAEIRMYHSQKLLTDEQLVTAVEMLLGDQGLILLAGSTEQKQEVLDNWAQRL